MASARLAENITQGGADETQGLGEERISTRRSGGERGPNELEAVGDVVFHGLRGVEALLSG